MFIEFNQGYKSKIAYEEYIDPHSKSKIIDKLATKLRKLITIYWQNLQYAQEL